MELILYIALGVVLGFVALWVAGLLFGLAVWVLAVAVNLLILAFTRHSV